MHRVSAKVAFVSAVVVALACSGGDSEPGVRRATDERVHGVIGGCWAEPRVGSGGVGGVRVGRPISFMPRSCSVRDSALAGGQELGHVVRFRDHEIVVASAANRTGEILRIEVTDPAFRTSGDVGVGSSIAVLRGIHPPLCATANERRKLVLLSEALPGVTFETSLRAPADPMRLRAIEEDSRLLPDDARIERIVITGDPGPCSAPALAFSTIEGLAVPARAGRVVADSLWSQSLGGKKELVVYLPPSYDDQRTRRYPVVVMLHGLGGDQWQWVRSDGIAATMDSLVAGGLPEAILVMPDGDDGWWTTWFRLVDLRACRAETPRRRNSPPGDPSGAEPAASYCVPWAHYDDYVARDVVARIDSTYRTLAHRDQRAIAGLSMGGYGAVALALAYPDVFGAAASHSGALSLLLGPRRAGGQVRPPADLDELRIAWGRLWWSLDQPFGDLAGFRARDPAVLAERLVRRGGFRRPALFIDVGTDDFLLHQNRTFHHRLNELGYPHHYAEWPGTHEHAYWRAHVAESLAWIFSQFASGRGR